MKNLAFLLLLIVSMIGLPARAQENATGATVKDTAVKPIPPTPEGETQTKDKEIEDLRKLIQGRNSDNKNSVECDITSDVCSKQVLLLSGDVESTIKVTNLPKNTCSVRASASEVESRGLSVDSRPTRSSTITVSVHLRKWFLTSYGLKFDFGSNKRAKSALRPETDPKLREGIIDRPLALLVSSGLHYVKVEAFDCDNTLLKTSTVQAEYAKWEVDGGGFYAFSYASDEVLTKRPSPQATPTLAAKDASTAADTLVVRRDSTRRLRTDTGVAVNFYPANYPYLGFTFGIAANNGRSPSYFLGTGIRLLSIGHKAVASMMAGLSAVQVQTFPGVVEQATYKADDPLLAGTIGYKTSAFLSIHLGFSIGGAGSVGSGSNP